MAQYNEILTGRYNRFVQKLLGMKGRPPAPQLSGDVQLSLQLFSGIENRFLEQWGRQSATAVAPVSAALASGGSLRNPPTSNVLAVLEKVSVATTGAAEEIDLSMAATINDLATAFATIPLDTRQPAASQSPLIASTNSNATGAAALAPIARVLILPNVTYDFIADTDQQFVLTPGNAVRLTSTVANQNMLVTFWWRERPMEEGEKT
jgi:hypothetical protein